MFNRILIANRGEIALRIIRACHELGIETISVYSVEDRDSLHVKTSDYSVCIGPASPLKSYLNKTAILAAAILKKADAIHPGFGFLSEDHEFVKMCEEIGIVFIGPSSDVMHQLGQKLKAKEIMNKHGITTIPGSKKSFTNAKKALETSKEIGFPVMFKAVSGGGGRGIRIIRGEDNLINTFKEASHEAKISFNDPSIYIEKFIENPKHIEFQIVCDKFGHCIHLGERDCSMQRRKQKVIEETPSQAISEEQRNKIGEKITKTLSDIGYIGVGTVEFLYEKGEFYFMEMNTRLQVEHTISEEATNFDIIKSQIEIASDNKLLLQQKDVKMRFHAIECRINAEDPKKNFMPSMGKITYLSFPGGPGIRIDSGVYSGYTITPYYDSMIAKIIAYDTTRPKAIAKMIRAINEFQIEGIKTNKDFVLEILMTKGFYDGKYSINFIENRVLNN
ncbi:MAG: acetyl-CoA carboxylase biotin carboxylase subunit [Candidatus Marinimicrobia bacterium]|nr:acetyl-CoA carboxylase biotin carboxylase subunit [Candidatus Neomarinimicrobiota bacterium]